jgi:hypothetical protein
MNRDRNNILDTLRSISAILAATLIPLALAVIGHFYTEATKAKERETHFVDLAVNILSQKPTSETKSTREWAIRVIDRYSEVKFTTEEKTALAEHVRITSSSIEYRCGNHVPAHIASSLDVTKVLSETKGCANWTVSSR